MKPVAAYAALVVLCTGLFFLWPGIDLAVSGWFYDPVHGFAAGSWWAARAVEQSVPWITRAIFALAAIGALRLLLTGRPLWRLDAKALIFIVAATAIGPGLVVNTVLKDHWGRARPVQVEEFGGGRHFTPAPLPADQCERNCAFVSGHAALGFSLIGFALLVPPGRRRRAAIAAALGFGSLVGFARIAAGGHFLSDIVFAGLISVAVSWALFEWIVRRAALTGPAAQRFYAAIAAGLAPTHWMGRRFAAPAAGSVGLCLAILAIVEAVGMIWLDRPIALFFHTDFTALRPVMAIVQQFGWGMPYMVGFGLLFVVLRWGPLVVPLWRGIADRLREASVAVGFLFAAVGASGLLSDLLKVLFGRVRPKLLFAAGQYGFGWFGTQADHWSFPSGHSATAAALATALWCLWPRGVALYIGFAATVALSRVVTGAHYPSDVMMGAFIGYLTTRYIAAAFVSRRASIPRGPAATAGAVLPRS